MHENSKVNTPINKKINVLSPVMINIIPKNLKILKQS
jgi:hypothetical protein